MGIPQYWIVDAEEHYAEVWTPDMRFPRVEHETLSWHQYGKVLCLSDPTMIHFSPLSSARLVPVEYRSNFVHLYLDIASFGVLSGSAMAFVAVFAARQGASAFQIGLLSAGPATINLMFALPAGRWLEKHSGGRPVFWASVLHRVFYLLWVPLPALLGTPGQSPAQ